MPMFYLKEFWILWNKVFCRMFVLVVMEGMTLSGHLLNIDEILWWNFSIAVWLEIFLVESLLVGLFPVLNQWTNISQLSPNLYISLVLHCRLIYQKINKICMCSYSLNNQRHFLGTNFNPNICIWYCI